MSLWRYTQNIAGRRTGERDNVGTTDRTASTTWDEEEKRRVADERRRMELERQQRLYAQNSANITTGSMNPTPTYEKAYPLEGQGIKMLKELSEFCAPDLLKFILMDMTQSNDDRERAWAAMHKDTPISAITMNLLSDKDTLIRYLAEKRVEAWEEQERKQQILNEVDDGPY